MDETKETILIVSHRTNVSPKYSSGRDSNYSRESKIRFWLPNRPLKKLAICMELIIFRKEKQTCTKFEPSYVPNCVAPILTISIKKWNIYIYMLEYDANVHQKHA